MESVNSEQHSGVKRKFPQRSNRYSAVFKLQVVLKYLEENVPVSATVKECRICEESVGRWVRAYRREGEAQLAASYSCNGGSLQFSDEREDRRTQRTKPSVSRLFLASFTLHPPLQGVD